MTKSKRNKIWRKGEIVFVEWRDAFHPETAKWMYEEDLREFLSDIDFIVKSVGFVIHEDLHMLTLAMCASNKNNAYSHVERIPKGCILSRRKLKASWSRKAHKSRKVAVSPFVCEKCGGCYKCCGGCKDKRNE